VNQEESEHNEVDGMKRGVDSTGIPQSTLIDRYRPYYLAGVGDYTYAATSGTPVDCTVP